MPHLAMTRRSWLARGAAVLSATLAGAAAAKPPAGYPRSYEMLQTQADREGELVVYSSADVTDVAGLLRTFQSQQPRIKVRYQHLASTELYDRYLREVNAGQPSADFLFSSAMDTQIKLVNDGYAQNYASPEKPFLPSWAVWKDQAYGLTAEPIVFAYNRRLLPAADVPHSHDDLERLLTRRAAQLKGKVGTYDVERSGTGFLFFSQDAQINHDTWKLLKALGRTSPRFDVWAHDILARVSSGEQVLAYNVMSSYALERHATDPWVEVVFPSDYTLVMSRIAFISKDARHPAAAKVFLDFLLSRQGQSLLAQRYMTPVRTDLEPTTPHANPLTLRAIHVGPELIADLDRLKYAKLLKEWKRAVGR
jgi:iron(III) transport system substrate-binding protein